MPVQIAKVTDIRQIARFTNLIQKYLMPDERSKPIFLSDFWAFSLSLLSILICIVVFINLSYHL